MQTDNLMLTAEKGIEFLGGKRIFFGHQSVGFNIMDGLKVILSRTPGNKLKIMETSKPSDLEAPVFSHARVGVNCEPSTKLADFEKIMAAGVGEKVDMAFFKFCYVDITAGSDIESIINEYTKIMSRLKGRYPNVTYLHVTVPLMSVKRGIKESIKAMLGRGNRTVYEDNIKRNIFNARLLEEYSGKESVFDLAGIEATGPDGKTETFTVGDNKYLALYPGYTYDGGHLNDVGRQFVAADLLKTLSSL